MYMYMCIHIYICICIYIYIHIYIYIYTHIHIYMYNNNNIYTYTYIYLVAYFRNCVLLERGAAMRVTKMMVWENAGMLLMGVSCILGVERVLRLWLRAGEDGWWMMMKLGGVLSANVGAGKQSEKCPKSFVSLIQHTQWVKCGFLRICPDHSLRKKMEKFCKISAIVVVCGDCGSDVTFWECVATTVCARELWYSGKVSAIVIVYGNLVSELTFENV